MLAQQPLAQDEGILRADGEDQAETGEKPGQRRPRSCLGGVGGGGFERVLGSLPFG